MKKMKKLLALTLAFVVILSASAFASEEIKVKIDGKDVEFTDVKPVKNGEEIFIPLRAVFEAAGAEVYWEGETQTIITSLGEKKAILQIGNVQLFRSDGGIYSTETAPYIENDRTYIPYTVFARAFDYAMPDSEEENTLIYVSSEE